MIWGKHFHLIPKITILFTILVEIEKLNIKANVNPCKSKNGFNRNGFCPAYGKRHTHSYG